MTPKNVKWFARASAVMAAAATALVAGTSIASAAAAQPPADAVDVLVVTQSTTYTPLLQVGDIFSADLLVLDTATGFEGDGFVRCEITGVALVTGLQAMKCTGLLVLEEGQLILQGSGTTDSFSGEVVGGTGVYETLTGPVEVNWSGGMVHLTIGAVEDGAVEDPAGLLEGAADAPVAEPAGQPIG